MSTRPSDVDRIASTPDDPPGWHVREKTADGYPLMGSSPAERAERAATSAAIRAAAMRDHLFVGHGPYCAAMLPMGSSGGPETGVVTMRVGCGYPLDLHPGRDEPELSPRLPGVSDHAASAEPNRGERSD